MNRYSLALIGLAIAIFAVYVAGEYGHCLNATYHNPVAFQFVNVWAYCNFTVLLPAILGLQFAIAFLVVVVLLYRRYVSQ